MRSVPVSSPPRPPSRREGGVALALGLAMLVLPIACEDEGTTAPESALRELTADCIACLETLTECTATAKNELHFLGCRDVFQTCQEKMQLGPDECGRPSDAQACELCKERDSRCQGGTCEVEFSVCKTFLMSRNQDRCDGDSGPDTGSCETCVETLAACGFSGESIDVCENTFASCRSANKLDASSCQPPAAPAACDACLAQHASCEAATGEGCDAGWAACVGTLATEGACGDGPNMGAGGGGTGGGEPGPSCSHDACEVGEAMSPSCDSCVSQLCELDPYCCETSYDETCVAEAQTIAVCGCAAPQTCAHDECAEGEILDPECSDCAQTVCEADGYCCTTSWDALCVQRTVELCGKTCE